VKRSGEVIWVEETARATKDSDGKTIVLIVCEDITPRKRMEQQLLALREELDAKAQLLLEEGNRYGLSFRELTVLHLVASGRSDREAAVILGISPLTVSKHVANVLKKMGASSRTEAGVRAARDGLINESTRKNTRF
jgi:DNA-binding NarL/FixJ family response regulator